MAAVVARPVAGWPFWSTMTFSWIGAPATGSVGSGKMTRLLADRHGEQRVHVILPGKADDCLDPPRAVHRRRAADRDVLAGGTLLRDQLRLAHVVLDHREPERDLLGVRDRSEALVHAQHEP